MVAVSVAGCVSDGSPHIEETRRTAVMCAEDEVVEGIDVSHWQADVDWQAVADSGIDFAFIRVSDGLAFRDQRFDDNWQQARAAGLLRGSYQFFRNNIDPVEQAQLLLDDMGPLQAGDLPPVIDIETNDGTLSQDDFADAVQTWLDHVEAALGVKPIIYTRASFWNPQVGSADFGDYPMWVAHYGSDDYVCPNVPVGWTDWTFHQYTSSGNASTEDAFREVDGIAGRVDLNFFDGSMDDLLELTYQDDDGGDDEKDEGQPAAVGDRLECQNGACVDQWTDTEVVPDGSTGCQVIGRSSSPLMALPPLMALITVGRRWRRRSLAN